MRGVQRGQGKAKAGGRNPVLFRLHWDFACRRQPPAARRTGPQQRGGVAPRCPGPPARAHLLQAPAPIPLGLGRPPCSAPPSSSSLACPS